MDSARTPRTPRRPSGSVARRGSASTSSRARSGLPKVDPERPTTDVDVIDVQADELEVIEEADAIVEAASETAAETTDAPDEAVEEDVADDEAVDEESADEDSADEEPVVATPAPRVEKAVLPIEAELAAPKSGPVRRTAPASPASDATAPEHALEVEGLSKSFGAARAVAGVDLTVPAGGFYGVVGPNGAGKTTTLSMVTGLLRPDAGVVRVYGLDMWANAKLAKRSVGVLPDRLRLFDRLTGEEFLFHAGALRGLDRATIAQRSADLSAAFGLEHSLHRLVSDYSAGMTKKIAIAAAMIHAPRLLVLDEPIESVDPVSTAVVLEVLTRFTESGGTVILSSHSMELIERVCDGVAIIAEGRVLAEGPLEDVLDGRSLEERFVELAGGEEAVEGMEWLQNFSD